jgi:hypothetical protein
MLGVGPALGGQVIAALLVVDGGCGWRCSVRGTPSVISERGPSSVRHVMVDGVFPAAWVAAARCIEVDPRRQGRDDTNLAGAGRTGMMDSG